MRAINLKAVFAALAISAVAAIALCPFAVMLHGLFDGDVSSFDNVLDPYRDFGLFADMLASCIGDEELRVYLLAMAALLALMLLGSTKDAIFNARDREVKDGILGDQKVLTKKRDILRKNYTWSGERNPPVDGIAIGSVLGRTVIAPANHAAIIAPSGVWQDARERLPDNRRAYIRGEELPYRHRPLLRNLHDDGRGA